MTSLPRGVPKHAWRHALKLSNIARKVKRILEPAPISDLRNRQAGLREQLYSLLCAHLPQVARGGVACGGCELVNERRFRIARKTLRFAEALLLGQMVLHIAKHAMDYRIRLGFGMFSKMEELGKERHRELIHHLLSLLGVIHAQQKRG